MGSKPAVEISNNTVYDVQGINPFASANKISTPCQGFKVFLIGSSVINYDLVFYDVKVQ